MVLPLVCKCRQAYGVGESMEAPLKDGRTQWNLTDSLFFPFQKVSDVV